MTTSSNEAKTPLATTAIAKDIQLKADPPLLCPWCFNAPRLTKIQGSTTNPELVACETPHCPLVDLAMTPEEWNERMARDMSDLQRQHEFDYGVALHEVLANQRDEIAQLIEKECCKPHDMPIVNHKGKRLIDAILTLPITQDSASASAPTTTVTDKGSVQHTFQSMHGSDSCWHCDRRIGDPIHDETVVSPESESSISSTLAEIRMRRRSITCEQSPPWSDELGEIGTNEPPLFVARTDRGWQDSPIAACYDGYTARFIANAPTDIDTLLSLIDSLQAENRTLRIIVDVGTNDDPGAALAKARTYVKRAESNMKAAILQRVREWGDYYDSQNRYSTQAGQVEKATEHAVRAETARMIATELEDIEVNNLEVK